MSDEPIKEGQESGKPNLHIPDYSADNLPKNKDEWNQLREADPIKWGTLTQANMDSTFRQNRELQEKVTGFENKINNITVELERYKTQRTDIPQQQQQAQPEVTQPYSTVNLPKNKEEWDNLAIDDPILAVDLRQHANSQKIVQKETFQTSQVESRKVVQGEHPDMYLPDLDTSGQPKKDETGKIIRLKDANGELIFNPNSEKGKIFATIFDEDPTIQTNRKAPTLIMSEMERRLRQKGQQVVNNSDSTRQQQVTEGQVVQDGLPPPASNVEVKYKSNEEKEHVEKGIKRGLWKDAEQYVKARDGSHTGFAEEGRVPDFSKKQ